MGYFDSTGYVTGDFVLLAPTATRTTNGSGTAQISAVYTTARLTLAVTAAAGSLTVTVETSRDGTTWASVGSFAAATVAGTERKAFGGLDQYVRVSWAITGTAPSFTFSVSGALL